VAILHEGSIVECDETRRILLHPQHEYTQRLMAAMPKLPNAIASVTSKSMAAASI
jgi:peptide/nickel transport system ATP-binding protein